MSELITPSSIAEVVAAFAQLSSAAAIAVGVFVAYGQLKANREAQARKRRAELAEELAVITGQVEDAFKHMRNPFDSIPKEKVHDHEFIFQKRWERITDTNELFLRLREYQVRCDAVFSEGMLQPMVSELFNARNQIAIAIEALLENAKITSFTGTSDDTEYRQILYGTWSDRDELGSRILQTLNAIREIASEHSAKK